jgi:hypothetical protein
MPERISRMGRIGRAIIVYFDIANFVIKSKPLLKIGSDLLLGCELK